MTFKVTCRCSNQIEVEIAFQPQIIFCGQLRRVDISAYEAQICPKCGNVFRNSIPQFHGRLFDRPASWKYKINVKRSNRR